MDIIPLFSQRTRTALAKRLERALFEEGFEAIVVDAEQSLFSFRQRFVGNPVCNRVCGDLREPIVWKRKNEQS